MSRLAEAAAEYRRARAALDIAQARHVDALTDVGRAASALAAAESALRDAAFKDDAVPEEVTSG